MESGADSATQTVPTDHLRAAALPQPVLFWVYSPERKFIERSGFELESGATMLGRESGGAQRVTISDDKGISRNHAELVVDPKDHTVTLRDQSTKNSTWVNGQRLVAGEVRPLFHGDVLRLGDSILVLTLAPKPDVTPLEGSEPRKEDRSQLLGRSPLIAQLQSQIYKLAKAKQPVLLLGERGTGKERAAQELHLRSGRSGKQVSIDCGALTETLAASELFGHVKGAFSGATIDKTGALLQAQGGTLFLDEIGNLSPDNQEKLLRALESRRVQPVGALGGESKPIDVMLVSATSRDIVAEARSGRFRPDLFDRIAGTTLTMPPLRRRREDILYLLKHAAGSDGVPPKKSPQLNTSEVEMLLLYAWPGNVRELINVRGELLALGFQQGLRDRLLRATFFQASGPGTASPGSPVAATALLEQKPTEEAPTPTSKPKKVKVRLTAETLSELLIKHDGKLLPIANETGWDSHTLRDWVAKYNLGHLRKKET